MQRVQKTVKQVLVKNGIGIHSGEKVELSIFPAEENFGIKFKYKGASETIELNPFKIQASSLATVLVHENYKFSTIEHLLSALSALEITNCLIELDSSEVPVLDGSSIEWFSLLENQIKTQNIPQSTIKIIKPLKVSNGKKFVFFKPTSNNYSTFNFTIDFTDRLPDDMNLSYNIELNSKNYKYQIAEARTFGFFEDIEYLKSKGLAKGGSLANAVVFKEAKPLNNLRFVDEPVRHKVLDAIGDFYLLGKPLIGEIDLYCSGHELNNKAIKELLISDNFLETN